MHQIVCRFFPDPTGGAYSDPPDPLARLRGLLLREGRGGEGRGEEGTVEEGRDPQILKLG